MGKYSTSQLTFSHGNKNRRQREIRLWLGSLFNFDQAEFSTQVWIIFLADLYYIVWLFLMTWKSNKWTTDFQTQRGPGGHLAHPPILGMPLKTSTVCSVQSLLGHPLRKHYFHEPWSSLQITLIIRFFFLPLSKNLYFCNFNIFGSALYSAWICLTSPLHDSI